MRNAVGVILQIQPSNYRMLLMTVSEERSKCKKKQILLPAFAFCFAFDVPSFPFDELDILINTQVGRYLFKVSIELVVDCINITTYLYIQPINVATEGHGSGLVEACKTSGWS